MGDGHLTHLQLDVYDTKEGLWNPEHGELVIPDDWEVLPRGDAFVTRQVKAAGTYWLLWQPRGKNRRHRRLLGVCAPRSAIERAQALAAETAEARDKRRARGARQRDHHVKEYQEDLVAAVRAWLDFTEEFDELAEEIARGAGERAAFVSSGRVGRTTKLPLEERAALAGRAYIRHRFTDYEDELVEVDPFGLHSTTSSTAISRAARTRPSTSSSPPTGSATKPSYPLHFGQSARVAIASADFCGERMARHRLGVRGAQRRRTDGSLWILGVLERADHAPSALVTSLRP